MTRRCSHCGNSNHNSRTCGRGGVKLFGVMLTDGSIMKKSASMGNLSAMRCHSSSSAAVSPNSESPLSDHIRDPTPDGYLSDDPTHGSRLTSMRGDRKKGVPWTEEEHLQFLTGLDRLGRGNWSGISRDYVVSRSPSQVASHAQKYFIRLNNSARKKRRSSLFDMVPPDDRVRTTTVPEQQLSLASPENKGLNNTNAEVSLDLSLNMESEPMRHDNQETAKEGEETQLRFIPIVPGFFPAYVPVSYPFWPNVVTFKEEREAIGAPQHQVLKPIPVHGKEAVNIDEVVRMSKLSIIENSVQTENILGEPSRQSAFHKQCFGQ